MCVSEFESTRHRQVWSLLWHLHGQCKRLGLFDCPSLSLKCSLHAAEMERVLKQEAETIARLRQHAAEELQEQKISLKGSLRELQEEFTEKFNRGI